MTDEIDDLGSSRRSWLQPSSFVPTIAGLVAVLIGFALLVVTWVGVANQLEVGRQLPYVVSGGFGGLAFVMVGLLVVDIAAKRQDAAERGREMERLTSVISRVQESIDALDDRDD